MKISALRDRARRWPLPLALGSLLCIALLTGCSSASSSGGTIAAASVNGRTISLANYEEVVAVYTAISTNATDWQSPSGRGGRATAQSQAMDFLLTLEVLRQQLAAKHLQVDPKAVADAKKTLSDQVQARLKQSPTDARTRALAAALNDDTLTLFGEQQADSQELLKSPGITVASAHLRVIAATTQSEAQQYLQQAQQGADFGKLAKDHSQDPSASTGGEIGTVYPGQLPAEFETVIFPTGSGAPAKYAVVQYNQASYVLEITQRAAVPITKVDSAQQQNVFGAWIQQMKNQAHVEEYVAIS